MVLDSVACNNVSFSENHVFYCFLVHEEYRTIDMQSSPYWSNSKQLGPRRMLLPPMTGSSCSNLLPLESGLCGNHSSETTGWIYSIRSCMECPRSVVVQHHNHLPTCPIWACPWTKNLSNLVPAGSRYLRSAYLWNYWTGFLHSKFFEVF